jgi:hypothetical protein
MTALPTVMPWTIGGTISHLASDQGGKVAAIATETSPKLTENGSDRSDIANAVYRFATKGQAGIAARFDMLIFLQSLAPRRAQPTPKQLDRLEAIGSKLWGDVGSGNDKR